MKDESITCAWCGSVVRKGSLESYDPRGICLACLGETFHYPIENVSSINRKIANTLPFGFIRLNSDFRVVEYNTAETALSGLPRKGVLGKNFFRTVAPCTCVDEFEGKVKQMMARGKSTTEKIRFLFKFPGRITMVDIAVTYDPERRETTLLIKKAQQAKASKVKF